MAALRASERLCLFVGLIIVAQGAEAAAVTGVMVGELVPPPATSAVNQTHYGSANCLDDEQTMTIGGVKGSYCAPWCNSHPETSFRACCPTDKPNGVTANPQCAVKGSDGNMYCVLVCSAKLPIEDAKAADAQCGVGASCKPAAGHAICTYDKNSTEEAVVV